MFFLLNYLLGKLDNLFSVNDKNGSALIWDTKLLPRGSQISLQPYAIYMYSSTNWGGGASLVFGFISISAVRDDHLGIKTYPVIGNDILNVVDDTTVELPSTVAGLWDIVITRINVRDGLPQ